MSSRHSLSQGEDFIIPWIGANVTKNCLSVLILSTNKDYIDSLSEALQSEYSKIDYSWKLVLHRSFSLKDIVPFIVNNGAFSIDFVIVAIDSTKVFAVDWTKSIIQQCHHDLLLGRLVLVNASGAQIFSSCGYVLNEINEIKDQMNLKMLTANVQDDELCNDLARRLLVLIETSIGFNTGLPNIFL